MKSSTETLSNFLFTCFLSMPMRIIEVEVDDPSNHLSKNETSVAVRLWNTSTSKDDGKTIVSGYIDGPTVALSRATDGGQTCNAS